MKPKRKGQKNAFLKTYRAGKIIQYCTVLTTEESFGIHFKYERRRSNVSIKSISRRVEVLLNTKAAAQTKVFVANL